MSRIVPTNTTITGKCGVCEAEGIYRHQDLDLETPVCITCRPYLFTAELILAKAEIPAPELPTGGLK